MGNTTILHVVTERQIIKFLIFLEIDFLILKSLMLRGDPEMLCIHRLILQKLEKILGMSPLYEYGKV